MQVTDSRITREPSVGPELQRVRPLDPRKIVQQIVDRHLQIVAVGETFIQTEELVPRLVRVADDPRALPRESPMKRIDRGRIQHRRISYDESLLWSASVCSGAFPGRNGACGLLKFCNAPRQNNV